MVLLAFVPAFIIVFVIARSDENQARDDSVQETTALAGSVADQYGALLGDTRTLLRAIGSIPADDRVLAQCGPALAALTRQSPAYDNLIVYRTDGTVVCSARPAPEAVDPETTKWFRTAVDTGGFVGLEDGSSGTETHPLTVAIEIEDSTGAQFVVSAQIALGGLNALFDRARTSDDANVSLVDSTDTVLFQAPDPGDLVGERIDDADIIRIIRTAPPRSVLVADGPDGVRRIYSEARLSEPSGAVVIAGIPTKVAYEESAHWLRTRVLALVIATLLALAVALAFAHLSVIRRIRDLVTMTRRIGAGDLSARSHVTSGDEIGELGRSLDSMADELRARDIERGQLMTAVVEASEEERKRIAGDVHDDSIQVMSAHVMNLQLLRRRVDDPDLQERIRELEASGRDATARLRDLVFELHSPTLEDHGLTAALESLVERAFDGVDVAASVASALAEEPPLATSATAYRVAQEAIRNARQHAHARVVSLAVGRDDDELVMRIVDDGVGFDPRSVADRPGHLGLRGMRERAAAVGGTIVVESEQGRGTTLVCRLPWLTDGYAEMPSTS
jgi:signal transduction histidine kinase